MKRSEKAGKRAMSNGVGRDCQRCGKAEAIVGFGNPPRWVCQKCFENLLAGVRALIDRATGSQITELRDEHPAFRETPEGQVWFVHCDDI